MALDRCNTVPALFAPPAPRYDPDLDALRDPRTGRFACVYRADRGRWRARVLKRINLSAHPTDVDAARAVLAWYRAWYGVRWREAFLARKRNPWRVKAVRRGWRRGWVADVFYAGTPVRVTRRTHFPGQPSPRRPRKVRKLPRAQKLAWDEAMADDLWDTRAEAVQAARRAIRGELVRQFGLFAANSLQLFWRGGSLTRSGRSGPTGRTATAAGLTPRWAARTARCPPPPSPPARTSRWTRPPTPT